MHAGTVPDVVSVGVDASSGANRTVAVEELLEEGTAGEPHPAPGVYTPVCV